MASGTSALPLASCLMPTAGRRAFVAQAIAMFLAQDYPAKELIVLDNGADPVADLVPADPRVRYHREPERRPLGLLRNRACELAKGDFLLHWDDDDWYAPWRVRYQLEALRSSGAELCGNAKVYFADDSRRQAWEYTYPPERPKWVCGATLCFTRQRWLRRPFPPLQIGEDTRFVFETDPDAILVLDRHDFFVGSVHRANTSPRQTKPPYWQTKPFEQIAALKSQGG